MSRENTKQSSNNKRRNKLNSIHTQTHTHEKGIDNRQHLYNWKVYRAEKTYTFKSVDF